MKLIYPAGPISAPKLLQALDNLRNGQRVTTELLKKGYAVFPVFCDFILQLQDDLKLDHYYLSSLAWMERADAVLVSGDWEKSTGVCNEIKRATELNIPVFYSMEELCQKLPPR